MTPIDADALTKSLQDILSHTHILVDFPTDRESSSLYFVPYSDVIHAIRSAPYCELKPPRYGYQLDKSYLCGALSEPEFLAQLAEECNELAQAALKLRRALDGSNPTPVTVGQARRQLLQEEADVLNCLQYVDDGTGDFLSPELGQLMDDKMERWIQRLKDKEASE